MKAVSNLPLRKAATLALHAIAYNGKSANEVLESYQFDSQADQSLFKSLVLGCCRYYLRLQAAAHLLLQKPFKNKDKDLECLIIVGLYQLEYSRIPDHAAIAETVETTNHLKKSWATNLVNAVLRNFLRDKEKILTQLDNNWDTRFASPEWLINTIKPFYKGQVDKILEASNQQAPMILRVNSSRTSRDDYLVLLEQAGIQALAHPLVESAVVLEQAVNVHLLPHFDAGWVSVQDAAAQLAAWLLAPQANTKILDACSAPGGKAAHLLEMRQNDIELFAVDIDQKRCQRISENFKRLELKATIECCDALTFLEQASKQDESQLFDHILLDVPCSATGVIRRHPDIKLLRRCEDIEPLVMIQSQLLQSAWSALKSGGTLLYATCSILQQENSLQIEQFLAHHQDATLVSLPPALEALSSVDIGCQILPDQLQMDGFYYAKLKKS